MFYKVLISLLFSTFIYGGEIIWSSGISQSVSDVEYNEAIREYATKRYPKELKAWKKREIAIKSVIIEKLMWQDDRAAKTVTRSWEGAKTYCSSLEFLGFNDWRLPTKSELESIVDSSRRPTIKKEFNNVSSSAYWSATTYQGSKYYAWFVHFNYEDVDKYYKHDNLYVRCVRTGG